MTDPVANDSPHAGPMRAEVESHLSWLRTRLSVERTAMSWVRTSASLIGFGFAIVQFFEHFAALPGVAPARNPNMPIYLGIALIVAGVLGQLIAIWQYRLVLKYLWGPEFRPLVAPSKAPVRTPVMPISLAVVLIGTAALIAVVWRVFW